jgi:tRNA dimethylallyltransferase
MKPRAIFILGPTASGKTQLAFDLIERFKHQQEFEIISVDSALVYRDMNIGTAKPDAATLKKYPHHLIDLIDPTEAYSAARFCREALPLMAEIVARGAIPLLVGGTMLYAKALTEGLSDMPESDPEIRRELDERASKIGWPAMHVELAKVDAITAARLKPNDSQRIQRALEIFQQTGTPISEMQTRASSEYSWPYETLMIGLMPDDRAVLHARIAARFDAMLAAGLIDEVKQLRQKYSINCDMPSMRAVGYRQTWEFLDRTDASKAAVAELREKGIAATRQLAKRQMTWLRSMPQVEMFDCLRADLSVAVSARVEDFLPIQK